MATRIKRRSRAKCYTVMLGARKPGGAGGSFSAADEARMRAITQQHFPDGFTMLEAKGGWFDARAGRFIREESRQIIVVARSAAQLRRWCVELAETFQQTEVLATELGPVFRFARRVR